MPSCDAENSSIMLLRWLALAERARSSSGPVVGNWGLATERCSAVECASVSGPAALSFDTKSFRQVSAGHGGEGRRLFPSVNVLLRACKQILIRFCRRTYVAAIAGMAQKSGYSAPPPRIVFRIDSGTNGKALGSLRPPVPGAEVRSRLTHPASGGLFSTSPTSACVMQVHAKAWNPKISGVDFQGVTMVG